ncbi:MAG: ATP-binding protein, partial [Terrimesophilobacter sp.]
ELSAALDVAAYRIVGEAVTNAVRHADASQVVVSLTVTGTILDVVVTDDVSGLPAEPVPGLGLGSMQLRAEELGGELTVSATSAGVAVVARIPVAVLESTPLVGGPSPAGLA